MPHPNAALTPRHRLKVARLVVDDGGRSGKASPLWNCHDGKRGRPSRWTARS